MSMTFTPAVLIDNCYRSVFTETETTQYFYEGEDGDERQVENAEYLQHSELTCSNSNAYYLAELLGFPIEDGIMSAVEIDEFDAALDQMGVVAQLTAPQFASRIDHLQEVIKLGKSRGATHIYAA